MRGVSLIALSFKILFDRDFILDSMNVPINVVQYVCLESVGNRFYIILLYVTYTQNYCSGFRLSR